MSRYTVALCATLALTAPQSAHAQEQPAKSKIVSIGLFKNGLAVVKQQIDVAGPGSYRFDDVPEPVHGTWWVEGAGVETSVEMRETNAPDDAPPSGNLQLDLAGKNVTIHLRTSKLAVIQGTVLKFEEPKGEPAHGPGRFLIMKTAKGRAYVDSGDIAAVEVEGADNKVKLKKAVLVLRVDKADAKPIHVSYLARGLSWASSYRVDITDPKVLKLELGGVVRNELADLKQAEFKLISGFPSVQFAHVTSPLAPKTNWLTFFQELRGGGAHDHALMSQQVLANSVFNNRTVQPLNMAANPAGEGVDLHYQSIGKRTLAKGDALALTIAQSKANYERIVEWIIPDNRDEHGRYTSRTRGEDDLDEPWDALRFKNPFDFPMTTGPAMVVSKGQFNGQRTSYWVNAGEETALHITKALSVRTRAVEQEVADKNGGDREIVYIGGNRYRRSIIAAEVLVSNHRAEAIKMVIRRRFSGELLKADADPKTSLREEGVYSVNKRNEVTWTVPLKGGEERTLQYRYSVLVYH